MRDRKPSFRRSNQPSQRVVHKSDLTVALKWLVENMQKIGYGRFKQLVIINGQPLTDPPPRIYRDKRLTGQNSQRTEAQLADFILKEQVVKLFEEFDRIGNGVISRLEVRDGLPYGMTLEEPVRA
jgi:hypothetical protein